MADFDTTDNLRGSTFRDVSLADSSFREVNFAGSVFREAYFGGVRMSGVQLEESVIDGSVEGLIINGVEVEPLIEAELDRRHPGRSLLRSADADELQAGWAWLEQEWKVTTDEALARGDDDLRLRVNDEWSFLETLRHLVFATDSWLAVGILGRTSFDPLGLAGPWLNPATCNLRYDLEPTTNDVLAARARGQALVRDYLATATNASLSIETTPPPGVGWPPPHPMTALARLHVVLIEEWWHLQFARRDMAARS